MNCNVPWAGQLRHGEYCAPPSNHQLHPPEWSIARAADPRESTICATSACLVCAADEARGTRALRLRRRLACLALADGLVAASQTAALATALRKYPLVAEHILHALIGYRARSACMSAIRARRLTVSRRRATDNALDELAAHDDALLCALCTGTARASTKGSASVRRREH